MVSILLGLYQKASSPQRLHVKCTSTINFRHKLKKTKREGEEKEQKRKERKTLWQTMRAARFEWTKRAGSKAELRFLFVDDCLDVQGLPCHIREYVCMYISTSLERRLVCY